MIIPVDTQNFWVLRQGSSLVQCILSRYKPFAPFPLSEILQQVLSQVTHMNLVYSLQNRSLLSLPLSPLSLPHSLFSMDEHPLAFGSLYILNFCRVIYNLPPREMKVPPKFTQSLQNVWNYGKDFCLSISIFFFIHWPQNLQNGKASVTLWFIHRWSRSAILFWVRLSYWNTSTWREG